MCYVPHSGISHSWVEGWSSAPRVLTLPWNEGHACFFLVSAAVEQEDTDRFVSVVFKLLRTIAWVLGGIP